MIRVRTGSRIHLGLIAPAGIGSRVHGGCGFMVEEPGIELVLSPAKSFETEGPLASRARGFAEAWAESEGGLPLPPVRITIDRAPQDHLGLGTGTQLGLATAAALSTFANGRRPPAEELARRVGRGSRSAIGIHGFDRGGFLVDGGRRAGASDGIAPLIGRWPIPRDWRVILVVPEEERGLSGAAERGAFSELRAESESARERRAERMSRLLLLGMLPALAERDLDSFGEAAWEFGRESGAAFERAQGGVFSSPRVGAIVDALRAEGIRGVGQSSWGPAVWAWAAGEEEALAIARAIVDRLELRPREVRVTRALESGAELVDERPEHLIVPDDEDEGV